MFQTLKESLLQLAFPHICLQCGRDLPQKDQFLCLHCLDGLPRTDFHLFPNNPVEKIFWGRASLTSATAQYYFTRHSAIQQLMHEFKYRGNQDFGLYLGRLMGAQLAASNRFRFANALIPLPLHPKKQKKRGFNQASLLCRGMGEIMGIPVLENVVRRVSETETQTKKNRTERWENMKGRFMLCDEASIREKHVILVDDVVTTGATLEACSRALLEAENTRVSIATLCISST